MILVLQFGDIEDWLNDEIKTEKFVWRGRIRIAFFRIHPSGRELVCVYHTGYGAGQKLPRR